MKYKFLPILGIIVLGAILRFYKLNWGQGIFTHPDEYHIVGAVEQLSFPNQMNPHFFSYGTVTIYLIFFTQEIFKYFLSIINFNFQLPNPFLIGRFYSALFSTFTVYIVYKICQSFMQNRFSLLAALLVALTPGLIQQAHFATPESNEIFFLFVSLFFLIKFVKQNKIIFLILSSTGLGFAMGVKVSSIVSFLPLIFTVFIKSFPKNIFLNSKFIFQKQFFKTALRFVGYSALTSIVTIITFAIVAPYVFLDFPDFRNNVEYEGGLALGKFVVFYTRQFIDTVPVLFQLEKILPYALGPFLLIFALIGFILSLIKLIKKPKLEIIIIIIAFLSLLIPNSFLFAKWTRFSSPTFPFFAIFASYLRYSLFKINKNISTIITVILLAGTLFWTIAFFSIYLHHDVRIEASNWINKNIPENSNILVEGGNMIDVPLQGNFQKVSLDFYNLETDTQSRSEIISGLNNANYFIIQSRRVFMNHQRLPDLYPKTANFYNALFTNKLGFKEIQEFNSYPALQLGKWKLEIPDETAEETWSVFDHPVIRIFKKTQQLTTNQYEKILE